jgi:type I restriction enzyme S subunit
MKKSGFQLQRLDSSAKVRWFGPFARAYVDDKTAGVPFLSSSDMMCAKLEPKNYLSKVLTKNLERLQVPEGTILISRSGTIGNTVVCTKDYEDAAVSEHAIRVNPSDDSHLGVLYAFLQSEPGQFLLTRNKSGSVIESIYEEDVASLNLPLLPKKLRNELSHLIKEASALRVKANALLAEAEKELKHTCKLPDLSQLKVDNLIPTESEATVFSWNFNQRLRMNGPFGSLRIDATYHDPVASALAEYLLSRGDGVTLDQILLGVRNSTLRKRVYVDDADQGVPLIGGKQLIQLRPTDLNFLSKTLTRNIKNETVMNGWTVVSCGGTLGRTLFIHRNFEGWVLSQDVMRVIPDEKEIYPGFLFSFLASPYGQIQLAQRGYGSVIPRLRDFQFNSIAICIPTDKGKSVHTKVVEAFDARADARIAEDKAIELFMTAIREGKEKTESSWGRDY